MPEPKEIRALIEPLVSEVLEAETAKLRASVLETILARTAEAWQAAVHSRLEALSLAIAAVEQANSQTGILQELLDGLARFAPRVAVLLVRNQKATVWQSRGFAQPDAVRRLSLDIASGPAAEMAASRAWIAGPTSALDPDFIGVIGAPAGGQCVLLPLVVRERLAAIVYADAGADAGPVEGARMDILVRCAGLWVEVVAMRKAIAGRSSIAPAADSAVAAAHPASASAGEEASEADESAERVAMQNTLSMPAASSAAAPLRPVLAFTKPPEPPVHAPALRSLAPEPEAPAAPPDTALRNEPDELRRKARRFARLLIDEIKLYNETKLAEGRRARDIYARLKDEIDRSRAIYDKRYAQTPVAHEDFFTRELLENLAEGDPSLLGGGFPH
jgi:hypothetical protein